MTNTLENQSAILQLATRGYYGSILPIDRMILSHLAIISRDLDYINLYFILVEQLLSLIFYIQPVS